jgi:hypothetical protein
MVHVARIREMRNVNNILCWKTLRLKDHSEDLSVHGKIILEMILGK